MRPGYTEGFDEQKRVYILSHWQAVYERTGQPFNFAFQMKPSFTYNTEPPSRGGMVVRQVAPHNEFVFLKSVQEAFYVNNKDVTQEEILADLAVRQGINPAKFREGFHDPSVHQSVWKEFDHARHLGESGFPTLLGRDEHAFVTFTHGYQPIDMLIPPIEEWLN